MEVSTKDNGIKMKKMGLVGWYLQKVNIIAIFYSPKLILKIYGLIFLGNCFDGNFYKNFKNGKGELTRKDGSRVVGEWTNDKISGLGQEILVDGSVYNGNFLNDMKHGNNYFSQLSPLYLNRKWFISS